MMIAASEPQEFVPFGRQQLLIHPKVVHSSERLTNESTLSNKLSEVFISDTNKPQENWILKPTTHDGIECEEELYYKEKTVVWAVGPASVDNKTNRVLKCCYTSESPVQDALWCDFGQSVPDFPSNFFTVPPSKTIPKMSANSLEVEHIKNCICILNATVIKSFTPTGREFLTPLQFKVKKMWPIKYGLLLERKVNRETINQPVEPTKKKTSIDLRRQSIEQSYLQKSSFNLGACSKMRSHESFTPTESSSSELPTIFSLNHPLEEICPITSKNENGSYAFNPDLKIIFTSDSPSLCFALDRKTGFHTLFVLRRALTHESELCWKRETRPSHRNSYASFGKLSGSASSINLDPENRSLPFLSARTRKSLGFGGTTFANMQSSPYASFEPRTSSPLPFRPHTSSSPLFGGFSHHSPNSRKNESGQSSGMSSPSRFDSRLMSVEAGGDDARPLFPQICLQCVWVETSELKVGTDSNSKASKAFLSDDFLGQQYFCYLVNLKLHLLKLNVKSDEEITIGTDIPFIQAKDAASIKSRNMIAVLCLDGGVELFTGNVHIAKILISGVSSSVATPSYLSDFNTGPIFFSKPSPGTFPKRSSLVPQTAPLESPIFNESLSQFSPVTVCSGLSPTLPISREGTLVSIKDSVGSRLSLEYSSSLIFRLDLPNFGNSSLVDSIIESFRCVLPPTTIIQFLIKWYCTRNAPGCYNVSLEEEFNMFSNVLYGSLGYDLEKLRGDQLDQSSPVTRPKKQRTSESQSDDDWTALINSQHHALASKQLHPLQLAGLQLRPCDVSSHMTETPMISGRSSAKAKELTSTPISSDKYKRVSAGRKEKLECIDETPMHPKSFGKARIPSNRFQKSLEKGDSTPIVREIVREETTASSALCNRKSILYPHFSTVFYTLHLLYEELKLNILRTREFEQLVPILYQLAKDAGCNSYIHHYWIDYPHLCRLVKMPSTIPNLDPVLRNPVPSIYLHLNNILLKKPNIIPYPCLKDVNNRSKYLSEAFGLMSYESETAEEIFKNVIGIIGECESDAKHNETLTSSADSSHRVVLHLTKRGFTSDTLKTLPPGVVFTIYEALYRCRDSPRPDLGVDAFKMIERNDLASLCRSHSDNNNKPTNKIAQRHKSAAIQPENEAYEADGMNELTEMDTMKLRWATDQRVIELRRMLQSAFPVRFSIQQRPEVSDHDFLQEQERHLYAICVRTMALPVARGMVTLSCGTPVITEKLPIPQLCLTGKVAPNDKVVDMSHIEVTSNMNEWPLFHNGVAAGLLIPSNNTPDINAQWIVYNKPKANVEEQTEHAGFLMALGLNGHLKDLKDNAIFSYLGKSTEFTKVGLMLGIAISKRGTMDPAVVRMVSVHTEAMLPPTGIEIEIDVIVVPAALMSLGFLYQGTGHRHITQVLLQEIGRPPGPEMENSIDRESYSLAAGLALGLVVFGQGESLSGFADAELPNTLHHFMVGGPKQPYLGAQRDKYKTPSFLIFEGSLVNTHVTGPGATLALGMMYFNTGNKAVAEWLKVPETQHLLETVLPDALLLRTLTKSLILWKDITPSKEWVLGHVPAFVLPHCMAVKPEITEDANNIDYETMNQTYCNIVAGACMAIGLRFAGSADVDAFDTLLYFALKFTMLFGRTLAEICGRSTLETCLNAITVSLGMVMAGTGNLEVMRLCRHLRSRVGPNNTVVTYGSHLATHMALGLLFLGGGTLSLSSSPSAVAALLCAFYPKWPICSSDNRYHLQALRHLYVLAVEPRLFLPRDIETRTLCYTHVTYVYIDNCRYDGKTVKLLAPCLLPELHLLKEVRIEDDRYWSIVFKEGENWDELLQILDNNSFIDVKRRSGCLSYVDDPQGFRSLLGQTLTSDETIPWGVRPPSVCLFSSNPTIENFINYFFDSKKIDNCSESERKTLTAMADFTYFCLTKDKLSLLPHWLSLIQLAQTLHTNPNVSAIWQWKLIFSLAQRSNHRLMPPEVAVSVKQDISSLLSSWEPGVLVQIRDYLLGNLNNEWKYDRRVTTYLTFQDIGYRDDIDYSSLLSGDIPTSLLKLTTSGYSPSAILAILSILQC